MRRGGERSQRIRRRYTLSLSSSTPAGLFVGLSTLDFVWRVKGYPRPNSKNVVEQRDVFAGGPAANAAVVFSALGGRARLFTVIGSHPLSLMVRADLEALGVEVVDAAPERSGFPAMASILVSDPGGDRTVVSTAARGIPDVAFDGELADADVLLLDGHLRRASLEAARQARSGGIPVAYDAGTWKDGLDELLRTVDHAVCSEEFFPPGAADHPGVLRYLADLGVPYRAITRGRASVLWETEQERGETPVRAIEAVDTLGAGDFFHGAFAFALTRGDGFEAALAFGAEIATRSCLQFGTRSWLATLRA